VRVDTFKLLVCKYKEYTEYVIRTAKRNCMYGVQDVHVLGVIHLLYLAVAYRYTADGTLREELIYWHE
jgi:hypothetical protein